MSLQSGRPSSLSPTLFHSAQRIPCVVQRTNTHVHTPECLTPPGGTQESFHRHSFHAWRYLPVPTYVSGYAEPMNAAGLQLHMYVPHTICGINQHRTHVPRHSVMCLVSWPASKLFRSHLNCTLQGRTAYHGSRLPYDVLRTYLGILRYTPPSSANAIRPNLPETSRICN